MQTLATAVQGDGHRAVGDVHIDVQVGLGDAYVRTLAVLVVELVNDGIFDLVRHVT